MNNFTMSSADASVGIVLGCIVVGAAGWFAISFWFALAQILFVLAGLLLAVIVLFVKWLFNGEPVGATNNNDYPVTNQPKWVNPKKQAKEAKRAAKLAK
jgi:Na+(H+)/acetate symporter ActP